MPSEPITDDDSVLHRVGSTDDLSEGERIIADVDGREVGVFRVDGEYYALANFCPHQGGPVCEGTVAGTLSVDDEFDLCYSREDRILACPWHGWEFDITTGRSLPSRKFVIPTYEVLERDGDLYIRQ